MASMIQRCTHNLWCFLTVFLTCSVLQNMIGSFLTTGIQSIERQFQIPSSKSGTLISASRVGQISTSLFLAYFGSKGNRARWIGAGSIIIAFGCLLAALPNFIFPPKPVFKEVDTKFVLNSLIRSSNDTTEMLQDVLYNPIIAAHTSVELQNVINATLKMRENDETFYSFLEDSVPGHVFYNESNVKRLLVDVISLQFSSNVSLALMKTAELPFGYCNVSIVALKKSIQNEKCKKKGDDEASNQAAYGMVFAAITLFGVGWSLPWTLGTALIDDSVTRKSAPFYFAAIRSIRILGPVAGLWLGAGCFKLYVTLKDPPGLSPKDPRWIGAWWLGYLIIGSILFVPSVILFFYPNVDFSANNKRRLSEADKKQHANDKKSSSSGNEKALLAAKEKSTPLNGARVVQEAKLFGNAIALCLKSPIYVGVLVGRLFDAFAFRGISSFQAKFLENHYGTPLHEVSFFTGIVGALSYAGGLILGSFIMRRFKLDGRRAAMYTLVCSVVSIVLTMSKVFLSCQSVNNAVGQLASETQLTTTCNRHCLCDTSTLYPVCSRDGTPFFSPCHAGCNNFTLNTADSTATIFFDCHCANGTEVSREYCTSDCATPLYIYYALSVITGIVAGTAGIPNMLISLRAVPHEVRSVAMAFSSFLVSLLSTAPSPIIVGLVIDKTCLLWNNVCGRQGACLLYNAAALRIRIHSIYGILRTAGLLFDIWVWYWAANLLLLKESGKFGEKKHSKTSQKLSLTFANGMDKLKNENVADAELLLQKQKSGGQSPSTT